MNGIDVGELRPGDVLLSCGDSNLSVGIRELDGGSYSHASIWDGAGVIEAALPRVRSAPIEKSIANSVVIDAYRYDPASSALEDVVGRARAHVGRPYATLDLAWCTLIVAVSSWMPEQWSEMNALYGAGRLERLLRVLRAAGEKSEPAEVTCVELVAQSYVQAGQPVRVRLQGGRRFDPLSFARAVRDIVVLVRGQTRSALPTAPEPTAAGLHNVPFESIDFARELDWLAEFDTPSPEVSGASGDVSELSRRWRRELGLSDEVPRAFELDPAAIAAKELVAGRDWPAAWLTPRLLEFSPTLVCLGRVHER